VALCLSALSALRFSVHNLIAAAVWAVAVGSLGYAFGQAIEGTMGRLKVWEHRILAAAAIALAVYVLHRVVKARLQKRKAPSPEGGG